MTLWSRCCLKTPTKKSIKPNVCVRVCVCGDPTCSSWWLRSWVGWSLCWCWWLCLRMRLSWGRLVSLELWSVCSQLPTLELVLAAKTETGIPVLDTVGRNTLNLITSTHSFLKQTEFSETQTNSSSSKDICDLPFQWAVTVSSPLTDTLYHFWNPVDRNWRGKMRLSC